MRREDKGEEEMEREHGKRHVWERGKEKRVGCTHPAGRGGDLERRKRRKKRRRELYMRRRENKEELSSSVCVAAV